MYFFDGYNQDKHINTNDGKMYSEVLMTEGKSSDIDLYSLGNDSEIIRLRLLRLSRCCLRKCSILSKNSDVKNCFGSEEDILDVVADLKRALK